MFIGKIIKKLHEFLAKLFKGNENLEINTQKVLALVDKIKFYAQSNVVDILVDATPTKDDDKILYEMREVLARATKELGIVADGVVYDNPAELLKLLRDYLQKLSIVAQKGTLQVIAVTLLKLLESELSTTEANLVISAAYHKSKTNLATE